MATRATAWHGGESSRFSAPAHPLTWPALRAAVVRATTTVLATALGAALVVPAIPGADAAPPAQAPANGSVVQLAGTPHIWIVDGGALHWAADTRALSERTVNWSDRRAVPLAELQRSPISDPWLSAALVKVGDPIYLPKWETQDPVPTLLQIQSIQDVELFGINGSNYGALVLDQAAWEQRSGFRVADLPKGVLPPAVPGAAPDPTVTPRPQQVPSPTAPTGTGYYLQK